MPWPLLHTTKYTDHEWVKESLWFNLRIIAWQEYKWVPIGEDDEDFFKSYKGMFASSRDGRQWYVVVEIAFAALLASVVGLSQVTCTSQQHLSTALTFLELLLLVTLRPRHTRHHAFMEIIEVICRMVVLITTGSSTMAAVGIAALYIAIGIAIVDTTITIARTAVSSMSEKEPLAGHNPIAQVLLEVGMVEVVITEPSPPPVPHVDGQTRSAEKRGMSGTRREWKSRVITNTPWTCLDCYRVNPPMSKRCACCGEEARFSFMPDHVREVFGKLPKRMAPSGDSL